MSNDRERDLGDAVPPGVAVKYPPPLTEHDKAVKRKLERLASDAGPPPKEHGGPGTGGGEPGNRDD